MKKVREKSAAVVTVFRATDMTTQGVNDVARWMERQARWLRKHAHECGPRFVARFLYRPEKGD